METIGTNCIFVIACLLTKGSLPVSQDIATVNDRISINLFSYILYRRTCQDRNVLYYDLGISDLTVKACKTARITAISQHVISSKHNVDLLDFEIINTERSRSSFKLLFKESLLIARDRPSLYKSANYFPLTLF